MLSITKKTNKQAKKNVEHKPNNSLLKEHKLQTFRQSLRDRWNEESAQEKRNYSWSKAQHFICEPWWHGDVQTPEELLTCLYWWADCWQQQQNEFWRIQKHYSCSHTAKYFINDWLVHHLAAGQWRKAFCESNDAQFSVTKVEYHHQIAQSRNSSKQDECGWKWLHYSHWKSIIRDNTQLLDWRIAAK